ncbi:MAG TPA: hypothetical protein VFF06_24960 [Polyangia bacterium]|nr:hypothetical protein [Polyangia bacterium]
MFVEVMGRGQLAMELSRIADEARSARERLVALIRQAVELRERLAALGDAPLPDDTGAEAPARKLHSVQ